MDPYDPSNGGMFFPGAAGVPVAPHKPAQSWDLQQSGLPPILNALLHLPPVQQMAQQFAAGAGQTLVGHPGGNIADQMARLQIQRSQAAAMAKAEQLEKQHHEFTARRAVEAAGQTWTPDHAAAYDTISSGVLTAARTAGLHTPRGMAILDSLGGNQGSPMAMMSGLVQGSRFRRDPVTGAQGMSSASIEHEAKWLQDELFNRPDWQAQTSGLTQGNVGSLVSELRNRGMIASGDPSSRMRATITGMAGSGDLNTALDRVGIDRKRDLTALSPTEMSSLANQPEVASQLRNFDSAKVAAKVKDMSKAVSAMKDIFSDNGMQGSIPELMRALDGFTNNSMHQLDSGKVSQQLRSTYNMAQDTIGFQAYTQMVHPMMSGMAQQLGLAPAFATKMGASYMSALNSFQSAGLGNLGWGSFSQPEAAATAAQLSGQAAKSTTAQKLGAFSIFAKAMESSGGFTAAAGDAGNAARAQAAIAKFKETGDPAHLQFEYHDSTGKRQRSVTELDQDEFASMVERGSGGSFSSDAYHLQMENANENEGMIYDSNLDKAAELGQQAETIKNFGGAAGGSLAVNNAKRFDAAWSRNRAKYEADVRAQAAKAGIVMSKEDVEEAAMTAFADKQQDMWTRVGTLGVQAAYSASPDDLRDVGRRNKVIGDAMLKDTEMQKELAQYESDIRAQATKDGKPLTDAEVEQHKARYMAAQAQAVWQGMEHGARTSGGPVTTAMQGYQTFGDAAINGRRTAEARADMKGRLQAALAGLAPEGGGGMVGALGEAVKAIRAGGKPEEIVQKALSSIAGGVDTTELNGKMEDFLKSYSDPSKTSAEQEALLKQFKTEMSNWSQDAGQAPPTGGPPLAGGKKPSILDQFGGMNGRDGPGNTASDVAAQTAAAWNARGDRAVASDTKQTEKKLNEKSNGTQKIEFSVAKLTIDDQGGAVLAGEVLGAGGITALS